MTPRALDPDVVQSKLRLITDALDALASIGQVDGERLRADPVLRAAVERLITRAVDLAVAANAHIATAVLDDSPDSYRASFPMAAQAGAIGSELAQRLASSAGLRNIIVHLYADIDLDRLAEFAPRVLEDYRDYVAQVARFLLDRHGH